MDKHCQPMLELQPRCHELGNVVKGRPDPPSRDMFVITGWLTKVKYSIWMEWKTENSFQCPDLLTFKEPPA